jgi:hypothetical protein
MPSTVNPNQLNRGLPSAASPQPNFHPRIHANKREWRRVSATMIEAKNLAETDSLIQKSDNVGAREKSSQAATNLHNSIADNTD